MTHAGPHQRVTERGKKITEKTRRKVSSTFKMRVTPVKVTFGAQYLKESEISVRMGELSSTTLTLTLVESSAWGRSPR